MQKTIGFIGAGKMGISMVLRLQEQGWKVLVFDINTATRAQLAKQKIQTVDSLQEFTTQLQGPRTVWMMVPAYAKATAGKPAVSPVDEVLTEFTQVLLKGDIVIEGANSFYEDSIQRAAFLKKKGIVLLDTGVSGGPSSVRKGKAAIMVGGDKKAFDKTLPLFQAISEAGIGYFGKSGAGHFVKMVHNGIEYGMMQSLAEGFTLLQKSPFSLNLQQVANVYNNGSVITSRLVGWAESGFAEFGKDLQKASGTVSHTGEGEWTVKTAQKFKVPVPVIKASFDFRVQSKKNPSFTGKVLSMLRNQFGGHNVK